MILKKTIAPFILAVALNTLAPALAETVTAGMDSHPSHNGKVYFSCTTSSGRILVQRPTLLRSRYELFASIQGKGSVSKADDDKPILTHGYRMENGGHVGYYTLSVRQNSDAFILDVEESPKSGAYSLGEVSTPFSERPLRCQSGTLVSDFPDLAKNVFQYNNLP